MPSSSDQKPMIYVQTLGGFSIKTGDLQINDNRNQSKKPWALLEYPRQTHECLSTTNSVFIYFLSF